MGNQLRSVYMNEKIDIKLLEVDPFNIFYEHGYYPWINPANIVGFNLAQEKEKIKVSFFEKNTPEVEHVDQTIYDYISPCLSSEISFSKISIFQFIDATLYLIRELYSLYTAQLIHVDAELYLDMHLSDLPTAFNYLKRIYEEETDEHTINILRVFICNIFQYGSEWGKDPNYRYNTLEKEDVFFLNYIYTRETSIPWSQY